MFLGEFTHTIDNKGRLTLPAKLRPVLTEGVVVTRGLDGCLFIFTKAHFEALAQRAAALPLTQADARDFTRMLFSGAADLEVDRQGRVLLPPLLRAFAQLESEVIIVGVNTRMEVWNKAAWQIRCEQFSSGTLDPNQWAQLGI
jgi:MraZ protein